jgi:hypothetical protein
VVVEFFGGKERRWSSPAESARNTLRKTGETNLDP